MYEKSRAERFPPVIQTEDKVPGLELKLRSRDFLYGSKNRVGGGSTSFRSGHASAKRLAERCRAACCPLCING